MDRWGKNRIGTSLVTLNSCASKQQTVEKISIEESFVTDGALGIGLSPLTKEEREILTRRSWADHLRSATICLRHRLLREDILETVWRWMRDEGAESVPAAYKSYFLAISTLSETNSLLYNYSPEATNDLRFYFNRERRVDRVEWEQHGDIHLEGAIGDKNAKNSE